MDALFLLAKATTQHRDGLAERIEWVLGKMDIGVGGYFVLFGLLFSCGLGVPIPEDIPLLVAGVLVGAGHMHLAFAAVLAWCGIIGGDCILYYLGHRFGLNITRLPVIGKHVTKTRILKAEKLFDHYGVWVVAVGRLFAGIRGAMVIAAGTIRYSFAKFIIADGLAALVSGGLFIFLGYKCGKPENLHAIANRIEHDSGWFLAIAIVVVILFVGWKVYSGRKCKTEKAIERHEEIAGGLDPRIANPAPKLASDKPA